MKVSNVIPIRGEHIEMDDGGLYYRYGPDDWTVYTGSEAVDVYDCKELEKAYQDYREKHESQ